MTDHKTYTSQEAAYKIAEVAARLKVRDLTKLKLIKLVYIAHGYMLGLHQRALLNDDERIVAWKHGPVIPELYDKLIRFGRNPIKPEDLKLAFDSEVPSIDDKARKVIEFVCKKYRDLTAWELAELTHIESSPWNEIYHGSGPKTIRNPDIQDYYTAIVEYESAANV